MPEALAAVAQWLFNRGVKNIAWECAVGNFASASVARSVGFRYLGEKAANVMYRDGSHPKSWHGSLGAGDLGAVQPGWPAETIGPAATASTVQASSEGEERS
jgi:hypothetical protein